MPGVYERPAEAARRYFTGRGDYPWSPGVRTPAGVVRPTLHSHHDLLTVNEVFCRRDYAAGPKTRTVVDVGSNIGISALYFLTRNPTVRVRCLEPVPRNVERLRENLAGFTGRFTVEEAAVDAAGGEADFGDESSGRYGGLGVAAERTIRVQVRPIAEVLDEALAQADTIDVLKIDTEGAELRTVAAIPADLLERVRTIYFESVEPDAQVPHADRFAVHRACDTVRMVNRAQPR